MVCSAATVWKRSGPDLDVDQRAGKFVNCIGMSIPYALCIPSGRPYPSAGSPATSIVQGSTRSTEVYAPVSRLLYDGRDLPFGWVTREH